MAEFTGKLNSNEIFAAIYNMIISQQVFTDDIKGGYGELADMFRVDGSLYGDTKLYYGTDVLRSDEWGADSEATNLLKLYRPEDPDCQAITLDNFRQIALTTDDYLSKRAWGTEGAFSQFNSNIKGRVSDTKRVYDATLVNSYVGTTESSVGSQTQTIALPTVEGDPEAENRLQAQTIAAKIADVLVELKDVTRDYNDWGNLRACDEGDVVVVWNSAYYNKILKIDLPTIYHKDELLKEGKVLPARYFGEVLTADGTADGLTHRTLVEGDFVGTSATKHLFPGDLIPVGASYKANEAYTEDGSVICKIVHKNSVPFMSAFEVATSFYNPKSLTETNYLTFGHNTLEYIKNFPFVTLKAAATSTAAE